MKTERTEEKGARFARGMELLDAVDGKGGQAVLDSLAGIAPELGRHIIEFAFGEIYADGSLTLRERELATLASILSLGGCEAQLEVHIRGALNVGIQPETVIGIFMQCIPYAGFPRVLNAVFAAKRIFEQDGIRTQTAI
ncbi:MAG: carboxymuconolactone decarboxylase family protein [Treponemataceae bacterium]|nr:carboxymuconolactone decarboxylase family protein [Treponemataceae bacterium]